LRAREICRDGCGPYVIEVCVANIGDIDSSGFGVSLEVGGTQAALGSISRVEAHSETCVELLNPPPSSLGEPITAIVDGANHVLEEDESNNTLQFPQPNPTGCDVICTPTPLP
jgi:subtilase family serine protease